MMCAYRTQRSGAGEQAVQFRLLMKHVFFASYARADNRSTKVERAMMALRDRVRDKLGWQEDELDKIAFFDTASITTGQQWEDELADALKKSRVLICLCSPTYLNSAYCVKEFHVFRQRVTDAGADMNGKVAIIPIIWDWGSPKMTLPKALATFNYKHGEFPKRYQDDGLAPLVRLETQSDSFDESIEVLAKLIGEAHAASKLKDWGGKVKFSELPSYFDAPGVEPAPYNATVTVLHKDRLLWRPFVAGPSLGGRVDSTMSSLDLFWRDLAAEATTFAQDLAAAAQQKQVSIVIADSASLGKPQWRALLDVVDNAGMGNCAVLLAWNADEKGAASPAEIKAELQALLPNTGSSPLHDFFAHDDGEAFDAALTRAVISGRMMLIGRDLPQKVDSPALRAEAIGEGIAPDARPSLSGPGGENK
jgi:hypothetical protein